MACSSQRSNHPSAARSSSPRWTTPSRTTGPELRSRPIAGSGERSIRRATARSSASSWTGRPRCGRTRSATRSSRSVSGWSRAPTRRTSATACCARELLALQLRILVDYRDYHATTRGREWRMDIAPVARGLRVIAFEGARPLLLLADRGEARIAHTWYQRFELPRERERGLDAVEDHLHAGTFEASLEPGAALTLVLSAETAPSLDGEQAWRRRARHEAEVLAAWRRAQPAAEGAPAWIGQLVLSADQFVARRPLADDPEGMTVIAGYHWFGDWGRDTMIALPGLTLTTGRPEVARRILTTFARFVDQGMLPNRFPDAGEAPEYNTVDATLWYVEAIRAYHAATGDDGALKELWPVLEEIVRWHREGTRYGIKQDEADGLLASGEPGVQLTWMDAKVGDWVVTPRIGKPVETNALWYNA